MAGSRKLWLLFTLLTAMVANRVLAATRINSFNIVDEARIRNEHRVARYRGGQVRYYIELPKYFFSIASSCYSH